MPKYNVKTKNGTSSVVAKSFSVENEMFVFVGEENVQVAAFPKNEVESCVVDPSVNESAFEGYSQLNS